MAIQKTQRYCPTHGLVLAERQRPNHVLHLALSFLTGGLWLIVWLLLTVFPQSYRCPLCGSTTKSPWHAPR